MTSWFTSTLQSVREKSMGALEFVRKDLSEFTTTVKSDAETYLHKIRSEPTDDSGHNQVTSSDTNASGKDGGTHLKASRDRLLSERTRLQKDESTYLTDPTSIEAYQAWRESTHFDLEEHKGEIAQLLIDAPHVRSLHARLVPACTTYQDFWARYYFRLHQLKEEETRRSNLLKRAHELCNEQQSGDWDGPDDEWSSETTTAEINQPPPVDATSEQKESDTGDSWEREFDETDLDTSKSEFIATNKLPASSAGNGSTTSTDVALAKSTTDEFDDDWESWS